MKNHLLNRKNVIIKIKKYVAKTMLLITTKLIEKITIDEWQSQNNKCCNALQQKPLNDIICSFL